MSITYEYKISDRADGVKGHFCVSRRNTLDIYWEHWSDTWQGGSWASAGTLVIGEEAAKEKLQQILNGRAIPAPAEPCQVCAEATDRSLFERLQYHLDEAAALTKLLRGDPKVWTAAERAILSVTGSSNGE